jgi:hypothetical protein
MVSWKQLPFSVHSTFVYTDVPQTVECHKYYCLLAFSGVLFGQHRDVWYDSVSITRLEAEPEAGRFL